ncbi:MAG: sigma-54 dependent transcriptional regulator [Pseudomonadota bacterium]
MKPRVLVVDDDPTIRLSLDFLLTEQNYAVSEAASIESALTKLDKKTFDLLLLDMNFRKDTTSGAEGLEFLNKAKELFPVLNIVVMTAWPDLPIVVSAMQAGANDFIEKPWDNHRLLQVIQQQLKITAPEKPHLKFKSQPSLSHSHQAIEYRSPAMLKMQDTLSRYAKSDGAVLLTGENGTGKTTLARQIHQLSSRHQESFVDVNMGAIPTELFESEMFGHVKGAFTGASEHRIGRLEMAENGTLFLDEVGTLAQLHQSKLLRVLESGEYEKVGSSVTNNANVRIISASNADFNELIANQDFRLDLFYRLNTLHLDVPPMRERLEDIEPAAHYFLGQLAKKYQRASLALSPAAMRALTQYHWPGNLRELSHVIERAILLNDTDYIDATHIQPGIAKTQRPLTTSEPSSMMTLEESELRLIRNALERSEGNIQHAAKLLGISSSALYRRMDKFQLNAKR